MLDWALMISRRRRMLFKLTHQPMLSPALTRKQPSAARMTHVANENARIQGTLFSIFVPSFCTSMLTCTRVRLFRPARSLPREAAKHNGGFAATGELLSLCHIEDAQEVLNAGCGIGVASTYIARKYDCRVVGVDISEKMIEWSRRRAKEDRGEDRVEFQTADVLELPFEADRFDIVICESVLGFVEDKQRAIRELVRVTRSGLYVGLNETVWTREPSPELIARIRYAVGTFIPSAELWQALWEESGLRDRVVRIRQIDPAGKSGIECSGLVVRTSLLGEVAR